MFKIWFERANPKFAYLLEGVAEPIGPADLTSDNPYHTMTEADGVIASALPYTAEAMDQAPNLKIISRTGIGYDKVSIPDATARGIAVCNAPDGPTYSTAEQAILLMMAAAKLLRQAERKLREGGGNFYANHNGIELYGKTLGLVGLGRIGRHVAQISRAMGMKIIAYDPYVASEQAAALGVELAPSLEYVLANGDIVSLHIPLMDSTKQLMNAERFAQMKPGSVFVNVSRGGLVDEAALLEALDNQYIFAAGLDVTDPEPAHPDNPLLHRDNVVVTPHIASATFAGKDRISEMAIRQVVQYLKGERPPNLINPEVWKG